MQRNIVTTKDGSHSLFIPDMNEHYHSSWGAITESMHVFINAGFRKIETNTVHIFEMGFGTGLNALLTLNEILGTNQIVYYTTAEKYPLTSQEANRLNYPELVKVELKNEFSAMHQAPWNQTTAITRRFSLTKLKSDIQELDLQGMFDLIYFDAFAPGKQPQLWSPDIFKMLFSQLKKSGIITTYAAKGDIRRGWQSLGLNVEKLPGPPGKREFLRGRKK